jgi:5-methylcytosine-specific restriction endonuclease McrA
MTKEKLEQLKTNPVEYNKWRLKVNEYHKRYNKTYIQQDYVKLMISKGDRKRYKKQIFRNMSKQANRSVKRLKTPLQVRPFDLWRLAKKQKCKCALTGQSLTKDNVSLDHIQPVSLGGNNNFDNLRLVTKRVNVARQNMTDLEFLQLCRDVVGYNC